ncbi:MAG: type I-C CRISPR-associated protein Cas5c [Limnochordia bacterium]|jgi:CRISPR-associated protein Cas5d
MGRAKVAVKVWGDYACFSRPEFKVERVSYPVITPSAARGVLEAIFWKPEIRYEVTAIGVLKLGSMMVVLRNELGRRQGKTPYFIEDARQQRSSLILKDVSYIIEASLVLRPHAAGPIAKYVDQFRRRVERGQCYHTPYLGTREFAAHFSPVDGEVPAPLDLDLGNMLLDIAFVPSKKRREMSFGRHGPEGRQIVHGYAEALFFDAELKQGWLHVPAERYREIEELEKGHV